MEQVEIETAKREQMLKPLHDTFAKCKSYSFLMEQSESGLVIS